MEEGCLISHQDFYNKKILFFEINRLQYENGFPEKYRFQILDTHVVWNLSSVYGNKKETILQDNWYTILWHEPHLHNICTVAKEREIYIMIQTEDSNNYYISFAWENLPYREYPYDLSLPLLEQSDDTKSQIIALFSDN